MTHVVDKKISHGRRFIILKNTLNGFVRPSLTRLVAKYSCDKVPAASEPLFTDLQALRIIPLFEREGTEKVTVADEMCTGSDVIAENVELPVMKIGDGL